MGAATYITRWVTKIRSLCCRHRCFVPSSQLVAHNRRGLGAILQCLKMCTKCNCPYICFILFQRTKCNLSLCSHTAMCLCSLCVCCDSPGPGWLDHASHPILQREITSTALTSARNLHLYRHSCTVPACNAFQFVKYQEESKMFVGFEPWWRLS